eukprot:SAG11_NODE_33052_length_279_cov_0.861111_1_plen_30_part_10
MPTEHSESLALPPLKRSSGRGIGRMIHAED